MTEAMGYEIGRLPKTPSLSSRFLDVVPKLPLDEPDRWQAFGVKWTDMHSFQALQTGTSGCAPSNLLGVKRGCVTADGVGQLPFQLADVLELSTLAWQSIPDPDGEMVDRFDQLVSAAFAKEFATGAASLSNSLANSATPPTTLGVTFASAAVTVARALAVLETEYAVRAFNGQGFIHLPPGMLGLAIINYGVRMVNGHWETPLGNIVVADAGYVNLRQPTGGGGAAGTLEDWIYMTGPVWYQMTDPHFVGDAFAGGGFTFSQNLVERWRMAQGLIVFDPAYVTAVLAAY